MITDYSTLTLKRHWFGVNNNFINTGVDYPLYGAPDQIQNVLCHIRASLIIQNGLMSEWSPQVNITLYVM